MKGPRPGGCRCGRVRYELTGELGPIFHCHCRFCRQIHGAAFTTVALVPRSSLRWLPGSATPAHFRTPGGSIRHFCGTCASPLWNHPLEPDLLCLVVASLDDESQTRPWAHFNTESKAPWFAIQDDLPQFESGPTPEQWASLARANSGYGGDFMRRVVLVRHCESSGPAPEAPLTEVGRAQALELALRLESLGIDHVVSSPYARARATIEPFAARRGLFVHVDDRLAERRLSPEPIDTWREVVRRSFEDLDSRAPGGESGRETLARGWAAIDSLLECGHRLPVVVSHGQLLSLVLHSIDPSFGYEGWESLRNPDLYLLERTREGALRFERA